MNIDSISNGIVIDHITAGRGMELYELLGLGKLDCSVAIIKNAHSEKLGKKDIIKIDSEIPVNLDVIGYVDPGVSINIIRDGKLVAEACIPPDRPCEQGLPLHLLRDQGGIKKRNICYEYSGRT